MKTLIQLSSIAILLVLTVNLLSSCAPKRNPPGSGGQQQAPAPVLSGQGTSDSGGCNGVENKCFDSYIVDPLTLPAFKEHLAPLFANIQKEGAKNGERTAFEFWFRLKTWYIAPVDLGTIKNEILGIGFMNQASEQYARQTPRAIWIDQRKFVKMDSRAQADLLLHEFVMLLYDAKHISMSELCRASVIVESGEGEGGCVKDSNRIDEMLPPVPRKPLDEEDYANIRAVTGWLLQNAQTPISELAFYRILFRHGFDKRFSNPQNLSADKEKLDSLHVTGQQIFQALKGAQAAGQLPSLCQAATSKTTQSCHIEVNKVATRVKTVEFPTIELRIQMEDGSQQILPLLMSEETTLHPFKDNDGRIFYTLGAATILEKAKVGERLLAGYLIFTLIGDESQTLLNLESLVLKPIVIASVTKTPDVKCLARKPKIESFVDDLIVVQREKRPLTMLEVAISQSETTEACGPATEVEE